MKQSPSDGLLVNQKYIALVFGVSPTTIVNMKDLPSRKRGRERLYYIPECVQWFMNKEQAKLDSYSQEQALYVKAKRERQELALQKERGEVFLVSDGEILITKIGLHLKGMLEALPERLSGRLAGMSEARPIACLLKQEVREVLASFRKMKFP